MTLVSPSQEELKPVAQVLNLATGSELTSEEDMPKKVPIRSASDVKKDMVRLELASAGTEVPGSLIKQEPNLIEDVLVEKVRDDRLVVCSN